MTPGAKRVLEDLAKDDDCDLIQEGRHVYCGNRPTTPRVINELLSMMAVSILYTDGFKTKVTNYGINGTGRAILRRPELEDEIQRQIFSRDHRPFQIVNDRIEFI